MTEKDDEIWLIGLKDSTELDTPLPSNVHLLRKIYYEHDNNKKSFGKSIAKISDKLHLELERMGFRPMSKNSIQVKMKRLLNEYERLKYNRNCNKKWFLDKKKAMEEKLGETFKGYVEFTQSPTTENQKLIADSIVTESTPSPPPFVDQQRRRQQHVKRKIESSDFDSDNENDGDNSNNPEIDPDFAVSRTLQKRLKLNKAPHSPQDSKLNEAFLSEQTTATLDRNEISSRKAALTFQTIAGAYCEEEKEKLTLSHRTIHRKRIQNRAALCEQIKDEFHFNVEIDHSLGWQKDERR